MKPAATLEELRSLMQVTEKETVICPGLESGLPIGAITEISGVGKTEFVAQFLSSLMKDDENARVAWLERQFSLFPVGFVQRQIDLEKVLFVEAGEALIWSALQVLKAQIFKVVILYIEDIQLQNLRRLQVSAERAGAVVIWLTPQVQNHWPIHLRLKTERSSEGVRPHILKQRF